VTVLLLHATCATLNNFECHISITVTGNLKLVRLESRRSRQFLDNELGKFSELGKKDILFFNLINDLILIQITFKK